ncbi:hypothetical protein DICVIV_10517 [Dictyocaulus viviparus]|uniref:Uncharacterized protein n=1 Tax=Dictyocaulus viviparus TaxID=29172 RepID=A0A0D8XFV4_DICVI|nr:hypothetical protein DICVIV_10517 [Dictyocaulus viviparus]
MESEIKPSSSGFQSRTSYTGSLRSRSSIESVHDDFRIRRSFSDLTIFDDDSKPLRSSKDSEFVLCIERL